jgi:drug/metabolite transporter (DMT)-like permease
MPIFVALGAAFYLKEKVGAARWIAVVLGLLGTLVIVQPGGGTEIGLGFALICCSTLCATGSRIFAKELSDTDGAATIVAWVTIVMTPITLVPALFVWDLARLAIADLACGDRGARHYLACLHHPRLPMARRQPGRAVPDPAADLGGGARLHPVS